MTEIRILGLTLENFKCHKSLKLDARGEDMTVFGDNATGKTSIYDAFVWLLFGKDSAGNGEKNLHIKPLDQSGRVEDHDAVTAVEAVLLVNGERLQLRRTYKEVWTTRRGSASAHYEGNTSEFFVDGVPCKKAEFEKRVNTLVPEEMFRLLTSVRCFPEEVSWQKRREVLFDMAGVRSDREILLTEGKFQPLVEAMGNYTPEDFRKVLLSRKKGFTVTRNEIPARLSECRKTIDSLAQLDFAGAKAEAQALEARLERLTAQLLQLKEDRADAALRLEIQRAQLERKRIEQENDAYRESQRRQIPDAQRLQDRLREIAAALPEAQQQAQQVKANQEDQVRRLEDARQQWIETNSGEFSGGVCPACGQSLPAVRIREAREHFEAGKRQRLQQITEVIAARKEAVRQLEDRAQQLQETCLQLCGEREQILRELEQIREKQENIRDMEGYSQTVQEIRGRIKDLSQALFEREQDEKRAELRQQQEALRLRRSEALATAAREQVLQTFRLREQELRADGEKAAQNLERIGYLLQLLEDFARYKSRFVEQSINAQFRIARFRLFREQIDGGVEDRCDVVCRGVPYPGLNNGMKINAGIDIINALSRHYGVRVPLFVDNAESVTRLEQTNSQVIRLVVSRSDGVLRQEMGAAPENGR